MWTSVLFTSTDHKTPRTAKIFCLEFFPNTVLLVFPHHVPVNDLPGRRPSAQSSLLQATNNTISSKMCCNKFGKSVKFRFIYNNKQRFSPRTTNWSTRFLSSRRFCWRSHATIDAEGCSCLVVSVDSCPQIWLLCPLQTNFTNGNYGNQNNLWHQRNLHSLFS